MTPADTLLAIAAVAGGAVCAVVALRMTSGIGRLGLLLVLILAVLVCLGADLPRWQRDSAVYQQLPVQKGAKEAVRSLASHKVDQPVRGGI